MTELFDKSVALIPFIETDEPILHIEPTKGHTKSSIDVTIESSITLYDFEIKQILIVPSTSATLTITIRTSNLPVDRVVYLIGDSYFAWSSDDNYLYDYIRKNIHTIY